MKAIYKFEYIFAFILLGVLSAGFFILDDKDIRTTILTSLVGGLSAITTFFFTKSIPGKE